MTFGDVLDRVFFAIVIAAMLHVTEEHIGGFVDRVSRLSPLRITRADFRIVNNLFIVLCVTAAVSGDRALWLRMSVAGLLAVNAMVHVVAAILLRGYSPGMISAIALYVPLASYAYHLAVRGGLIEPRSWWIILLMGIAWHLVPPGILLMRRDHPVHI